MTLSTVLSSDSQVLEYALLIEGIGWFVDESTGPSGGFAGTVFLSDDVDGTTSTVYSGATRVFGLHLGNQVIADSYDPKSGRYTVGNMRFDVQDQSGTLLSTITPQLDPDATGYRVGVMENSGGLRYEATTVQIDNATYTWDAGSTIWIAGREAVKLGTRVLVGGSLYNYTSSTRGYLGTPRGRLNNRPTGLEAFAWTEDTSIHSFNRYWYDRRVILLARASGDAAASVVRIFGGRIRDIVSAEQGCLWSFQTVHDFLPGARLVREAATTNIVRGTAAAYLPNGERVVENWMRPGNNTSGELNDRLLTGRTIEIAYWLAGDDNYEWLAPAIAYAYRNRVPGGTAGMRTRVLADKTDPQCASDARGDIVGTLIDFDGTLLRAEYRATIGIGAEAEFNWMKVNYINADTGAGGSAQDLNGRGIPSHTPIRYLLDTFTDDKVKNRFAVNNETSRNPIHIALCLLTTMPNEYYIGDTAAGSTTTAVNFTAPGWTTDQWAGYALHCVEGANLGESRRITSNDADTITVDRAFSNAPAANVEYQIRNSIYDVLPLGWGMGLHNSRIDIDSAEEVRDQYLTNCELGKFAIGSEDKTDMWRLIEEYILKPYDVLAYNDRTTGKLKFRYVGEAPQDGLIDDYVTVSANDLVHVGDIDMMPHMAVGEIELAIRASLMTKSTRYERQGQWVNAVTEDVEVAAPTPTGETETISIRAADLESVYGNSEAETIRTNALLNDRTTSGELIARQTRRLERLASPRPEVDIALTPKFFLDCQAGALLSITDTTRHNPINPYTGERGWSGVMARVLSAKADTAGGLVVKARVQLLPTPTNAKIAPACAVDSKGNDANGDYVVVQVDDYTMDIENEKDWDGLEVDFLIELRDLNGALKEGPETITGFGANFASTTAAATGAYRVYIAGTWASAIAAGDHITLSTWVSASTPAAQKTYSYLGDTGGLLDTDDAKEYG